jgi:hypothetical protein
MISLLFYFVMSDKFNALLFGIQIGQSVFKVHRFGENTEG